MTFNERKNNQRTVLALGILLMLLIPSVGTSLWQAVYGNVTSSALNQNTEGNFIGLELYSPPELSQVEKSDIIGKAMNHPDVKKWSPGGWEVASISFAGSTEPTLNWDTVSVILKLPPGKGTPLASCSTGWDATIIMDLKSKKIIDAWYPKDPSIPCDGDWNKSGSIDESVP